MAAYPENLSFFSQKLASWSQNTVKVVPQTLPYADPQDCIIFTIPDNTLCDLSSLAICGSIMGIRGTGPNDQCVLPRHIDSVIDMISVEINGTSIDSSLLGYNHLSRIKHDFLEGNRKTQKSVLGLSSDYLGSDNARPLARIGRTNASTNNFGVANNALTTTAKDDVNDLANMNAFPFCISDFQGFLGCQKIVDTSLLGSIRLIIRLAPSTITMGTSASSYRLLNLRMYLNVCDLSDNLYYSSLQSRLEQAPLVIPFKRYLSFSGPAVVGSTSVRFSCSTQSLDAVYCMLLPVTVSRGALQAAVTVENASGDVAAPYFKRLSANVSTHQLDANSVLYPTFTCSVNDCWYLLQNTLGTQTDDLTGAAQNINMLTWASDYSLFSYRFSHSPGLNWMSGLDSRGLALNLSWNLVTTGDTGGQPFIIAETTANLLVGKFRSLSLIA